MYNFNAEKHAHTLNGKPLMGTTTLIKEIMPPPLSWWAAGKALEKMGWTNPKLVSREEALKEIARARYETLNDLREDEEWYDFLQECYKNHATFSKKRAKEGTDTHSLVEDAVKHEIQTNNGYLKEYTGDMERFAKWGRGKQFIHSEVNVYSELLWLGGQLDIVYKENDEYYLADLKTSKAIFASQFIQQGLYDCQQQENGFFDKNGNKVGEPLSIAGYTVITLPPEGEAQVKTYRGVKQLRELSVTLVSAYKTLKELQALCKK